MEEIKNDGNTKAITELKRIGHKLGIEEQQPSTSTAGSGKSSCCLLL